MKPFPTQITGALFLESRKYALLADQPRVGKTGAAIMASDMALDATTLVVTTASGRPVWERGFRAWSKLPRRTQVLAGDALDANADTVIVGWPQVAKPAVRAALLRRPWARVILDESHYAKNFEAKRTEAVYGTPERDGEGLFSRTAITGSAGGVWCLTGTPLPNSPADLYPMMRALCPERLSAGYGSADTPDVTKAGDFLHRYCVVRMKKIGRGFRKIPVVIGGRNLDELNARLDGFWMRRTQADVGIREPIHELMPLAVPPRVRRALDAESEAGKILAAAESGSTREMEMHLGPLRRITGELKAPLIVKALEDEFECGLDKIVVMAWHRETMRILAEGLQKYGVVGIDGSTPAKDRATAEDRFRDPAGPRVFIGQIQAAGEAIDLSAASELIFAETSFVPKDMAQASLRVTNLTANRLCRVRVAVLEGSIDEASQQILMRKWTAIREVLK